MTITKVLRIDLAAADDIAAKIEEVCSAQASNGFKLSGCFTWADQLVLIFQYS